MNIWYGSNENGWLSNLAYRPFEWEGKYYVSVEHAYQSLKSGGFDVDTYRKPWKRGSKFIGRMGLDKRSNLSLMKNLILVSFLYNEGSKKALVDTGDVVFTHLEDKGIWKSKFPELLMEVRDFLRG